MAVCNIFKPLENPTGTFLLFSQYSEDLIREATESEYYRVVPSKFIAAEIDYTGKSNDSVPKYLQDYFENGCAVCRKEMKNDWTPIHSANLFWDAMFDGNWLSVKDDGQNSIIGEVRYVGNINMQSYNEYNGIGYSEIFCYIPTDSKRYDYTCIKPAEKNGKEYKSFAGVIEGYQPDEVRVPNNSGITDWGQINSECKYYPGDKECKYEFSWSGKGTPHLVNPNDPNPIIAAKGRKYEVNTIILLYDIISRSAGQDSILYKNIPMGIYFTGIIENGMDMTNKIVKYISNSDIYGSGTSYGLKICSRFSVIPNGTVPVKEIEVTTDDSNESLLSHLLSEMSKSQFKMNELMGSIQESIQDKKDFLAMFKNSRINVPYVKIIGDMQYWFVNGRCVGEMGSIVPEQEETKPGSNLNGLVVSLSIIGQNGEICFDKSTPKQEYDVCLSWTTKLNGKVIDPSTFKINIIGGDNNINIGPLNNLNKISNYNVSVSEGAVFTVAVTYDNKKAMSSNILPVYWPSYFGTVKSSTPSKEDVMNCITNKNLEKVILPGKNYEVTYTVNMSDQPNNKNGYVTFAYPAEFGVLSHIYDDSKYDYIDDFKRQEVRINYDNSENEISYYVYTEINKAGVKDFTLTFS